MYKNFESLPEDKRKRILDVCLEEFAQNGYEKASTNEIVKKAEISKGILFHYFGNKKNLFLYVIDYVLEYAVKKFYSMNQNPPEDIFERILAQGMVKLKMAYDEPLVYELLFKTFINVPEEIKSEVQARYMKLYNVALPAFYANLDTSKFRKGVDPQKAMQAVVMILQALTDRYVVQYKNFTPEDVLGLMDTVMKETREYLEILKYGIYDPGTK